MKRQKVSIIGAGNVGSTLAMRVVESGLADVTLLDIYKNIAQGKAFDIMDASGAQGCASGAILGTDDYSAIEGSSVVVLAAGMARRPGMSREELLFSNASIVKEAASKIKMNSPDGIVIVVTNPLDAMTYLAYKTGRFKRTRVMGMAGLLDESRFKALIALEVNVPVNDIETVIMGSHGDTMVPILSHTKVGRTPLAELLPEKKIDELVARTRSRGAEIVNLLGSGSACYSPSLAVFKMVEVILNDRKATLTASVFTEGEYGLNDICIGLPVRLGKNGIESIVELAITLPEREALSKSASAITQTIREMVP